MSDLSFIFYSLKSRLTNSILSVLLTAFGVSIAILITQFGTNIKDRLNNDGKNIDIVVGAKGSPLQLILSSIYHIDIPTGNIPYDETEQILKNPLVDRTIPLALGDNWRGFRIVGTSLDYIKLYKAELKDGRFWNDDFEVVVGSSVDLNVDDKFSGSHGLLEDGIEHSETEYKVTGVLQPTNSVIDRLLITSVNSVLKIHNHEGLENQNNEYHDHSEKHNHTRDSKELLENKSITEEHSEDNEHKHEHEHKSIKTEYLDKKKTNNNAFENQSSKSKLKPSEITAFLVFTKSPIANINLPRQINKESNLQAANPAFEITRLSTMLGFGSKSFSILSIILILVAALSIFSGLASNLENRMGDLAILRALGYSRSRIFKIITLEGIIIVTLGLFLGLFMGFILFDTLTRLITPLALSQAKIKFTSDIILIIFSVFTAGLISALFPAYTASKISVAKQLNHTI